MESPTILADAHAREAASAALASSSHEEMRPRRLASLNLARAKTLIMGEVEEEAEVAGAVGASSTEPKISEKPAAEEEELPAKPSEKLLKFWAKYKRSGSKSEAGEELPPKPSEKLLKFWAKYKRSGGEGDTKPAEKSEPVEEKPEANEENLEQFEEKPEANEEQLEPVEEKPEANEENSEQVEEKPVANEENPELVDENAYENERPSDVLARVKPIGPSVQRDGLGRGRGKGRGRGRGRKADVEDEVPEDTEEPVNEEDNEAPTRSRRKRTQPGTAVEESEGSKRSKSESKGKFEADNKRKAKPGATKGEESAAKKVKAEKAAAKSNPAAKSKTRARKPKADEVEAETTDPKAENKKGVRTKKVPEDAENHEEVEENNKDAERLARKQKQSRKSSAYHQAKAAALKQGKTVEEANVLARTVPCLIWIGFECVHLRHMLLLSELVEIDFGL